MHGLLLVNLGTPDDTSTRSVRRYLREFLSDPRVIDLSSLGRWLLLNAIILPFRPAKSAEAYRKIWGNRGSPLLHHGVDLAEAVRVRLGAGWEVALGMRYGSPPVDGALKQLEAAGCDRVVVLPLYPQYASSSTGSTLEKVYELAGTRENVPSLCAVPAFHADPGFLDAAAKVARAALEGVEVDHVLFSFHGLPERQVRKADPTGSHCLVSGRCCDQDVPANAHCYRHQCYLTARALAGRLALADDGYSVSFQSRLGRTPWIHPYTDHVLPELVAKGIKRLAVLTPSFVADCLETLEEIGIRGRDQFLACGGEHFVQVPCVNVDTDWAEAVAGLARQAAGAA